MAEAHEKLIFTAKGLGSTSGNAVLNIARNTDGSSILSFKSKEKSEHYSSYLQKIGEVIKYQGIGRIEKVIGLLQNEG